LHFSISIDILSDGVSGAWSLEYLSIIPLAFYIRCCAFPNFRSFLTYQIEYHGGMDGPGVKQMGVCFLFANGREGHLTLM